MEARGWGPGLGGRGQRYVAVKLTLTLSRQGQGHHATPSYSRQFASPTRQSGDASAPARRLLQSRSWRGRSQFFFFFSKHMLICIIGKKNYVNKILERQRLMLSLQILWTALNWLEFTYVRWYWLEIILRKAAQRKVRPIVYRLKDQPGSNCSSYL